MKHSALIAVAAVSALGLTGCNSEPDLAATPETTETATGALATPPPPTDAATPAQAFANTAAASDAFEIESSKLAETHASSDKIKTFATQMIEAHTDSTNKLKEAAAAASPPITPVPQLTPAQQQTLDTLATTKGQEFDTAYAQAQADAHQKALDGLKAYAEAGDVPSLKNFASQLVPTVTAHLNMAKAL
jgi:putative membrane protein